MTSLRHGTAHHVGALARSGRGVGTGNSGLCLLVDVRGGCQPRTSAMSRQEHIERVWEIADEISVCMVTTHAGNRMRSRPMHAFADQDAGCFWFITDTRGLKDEEIEAAPDVCLNFADISDNTYLSVTGRTEIIRDPAKAE